MSQNLLVDRQNLVGAKGHQIPGLSGALTVITSAQDVYGFQNDATNKPFVVTQITMSFHTTTAFSSAQACPWGLFKVAGFTVVHDAGSGIKTIAPHRKRVYGHSLLANVNARMAAAVPITGATYTAPDADEPDYVLPTTLSTTPVGSMVWTPGEGCLPDVLDEHEGYVCRPLITMGTAGVGTLYIKIEGHIKEVA